MKTVAQFMQDAMYDKNCGYYISGDPIGKERDFITAPEISQLFGEMIGIYCANAWIQMGSPAKFNLVELGPGRATLMKDLLRATKNIEGFTKACKIHLVETNKAHIEIQKDCLDATWHNCISSLPKDFPTLVIANEFFDCLPIHQYIFENKEWHERYIDNEKFTQALTSPDLNNSLCQEYPKAKNGDIIEISYQTKEIVKNLCNLLKETTGSMLIIDYGYETNDKYISTLQAIKNHKYSSIFKDIGKTDLTAHVNFSAIKKEALLSGCEVSGTFAQGEFLNSLGIKLRAEILKRNTTAIQIEEIDSGLNRLINPKEMGTLFKILNIYSKK